MNPAHPTTTSAPLRLLIHGLNYAPEPVGVGKYTAEMAEWLALRGIEVRVVTARPYYPWWRAAPAGESWDWREERGGVRVLRCPLYVPSKPGGLRRVPHLASFAAASLPALAAHLAWRPQVVLAVAPTLAAAPAALALARACNAVAWLHVQDLELDMGQGMDFFSGPAGRAVLRLAMGLERAVLRRFGRVTAVSQGMVQALESKGVPPGRLGLTPNWADLVVFRPEAREEGREAFRRLLGLEQGRAVALYAGSMGRKQDLDLAALAARLLHHEHGPAAPLFVLCGQGPELDRLRREHGQVPNLRFLPLRPEAEHAAMLAGADAHILPQRQGAENRSMPSKLASILACGGPVVATASPGSELARAVSEAGGLVVAHADAEGLARAVARLATDEDLRRAARRAARRYAVTHLNKDVILDRLRGSILELVHGGRFF